ncbi:unnamed protein product, partial [Iphiclides podalirius]
MDDLTPLKTDHKQVFTVLENSTLTSSLKHKNTVTKYTKLPHFDSKASWPHHNHVLRPRFRRIVTLEDQPTETTRSIKQKIITPNMITTNSPKRKIKIITIEDDADSNYFSNLSKDVKKTATLNCTNRAIQANYTDGKSQDSRETRHHTTKSKDLCNKNQINKQSFKQLHNKEIKTCENDKRVKMFHTKGKDMSQNVKKSNKSKISTSKNFQRELNFIDSFFESLQYLETLSERSFTDVNLNSLTYNKPFKDNKHSGYFTNFTKIENGPCVDDTETMATKSLCQLNLLIHNEQRRARDFLFVLKMQEDVLKDYIKSQMLWLEKKKKQDNTDISALKKKQRGALLKLQHECGEMQRMRKALLTLSEKRKVALMRTKKNIEMKLKNNVNVEQILLGKKKLKRNTASDRCVTPIKCFELSSSCEDSTTSRTKTDCAWYSTVIAESTINRNEKSVTSAEKSIQTGDSISAVDANNQSTATAAENCIVVDGGYLNILFHNLSVPQIFSSGKQYEVNEEALKNIVNSSNACSNISKDTDAIEKFIEQVKNHETEGSSGASTAHSLVEEFDQYYKCLDDEDKSLANSPDSEGHEGELKEAESDREKCDHDGVSIITMEGDDGLLTRLSEVYEAERSRVCEPTAVSVEVQTYGVPVVGASVAGPLPVPAGEAAIEPQADQTQWTPSKLSSDTESSQNDQVFYPNITPIPQYTSPVLHEAEELRRQQLAIEREIKALEQQQCLLVVREIPDKPPPPYTPPSETRMPKTPHMFMKDGVTEEKIHKHFVDLSTDIFDISDPFDGFVKDFCDESIQRQRSGISDKPWDAYNLLPQRPQPDTKKIVEKTCTELKEVLSGVTPTYVSGVSSRRTDHIDDILYAEWRRCEPEWTSLHTDEALVKNQLFESIFEKILTETIGEYKKIVCNDLTKK